MGFCEYCKLKLATHYCYGCGKYICNSPACIAKGAFNATIGRWFLGR